MAIFKSIANCIKFINNYFKTFLLLIILVLFFSFNSSKGAANLAQIELKGTILDSMKLVEQINEVKDDDNIKGVLFFIDSPGGAFAPSMEISLAIKELGDKKPVIVYAGSTLASGSYLSAIYANKIIANPASFVGSIGVIMQGFNVSSLAQKIGISEQTISAGAYKQAGTMLREWSIDEKEYLQDLINQSYDLFTSLVAKARKLDLDKKEDWANAKVFLADKAMQLGLIDEVANISKAKKELEELTQISKPVYKTFDDDMGFISSLSKNSALFLNKLMLDFITLNSSAK